MTTPVDLEDTPADVKEVETSLAPETAAKEPDAPEPAVEETKGENAVDEAPQPDREPEAQEPEVHEATDPAEVQAPEPDVQEPEVKDDPDATLKVHLTLVLDNGTRIGCHPKLGATEEGKAAMLHFQDGFAKGLVTDADVNRMSVVLGHLDATRKRKLDQIHPPLATVPSYPAAPSYPVVPSFAPAAPPPALKRAKSVTATKDAIPWKAKCREIVNILKGMKSIRGFNYFLKPVDRNEVKDYYRVIRNPKDLSTVSKTLAAGKYASPAEFAADMELIWNNSAIYNKPQDDAGQLGLHMQRTWEQWWEQTGFGGVAWGSQAGGQSRGRRMTAGQAPAKYEPPLEQPSESRRSWGNKPRTSQPRASGSHANARGGEVVSSGREARGPMDGERLKLLGTALEDMSQDAMEGILDIVRATGQFDGMEDEIELDLDTLPTEAIWQLDDYAKTMTNGRYNPDARQAPVVQRRGPVVEGDTDEDTDDD